MLKSPEVAELVGVSEDTLKRWRRRTRRENKQIGPVFVEYETGIVRYDPVDVQRFIAERKSQVVA